VQALMQFSSGRYGSRLRRAVWLLPLLAAPAWAQWSEAGLRDGLSDPRAWLQRANEAAVKRNYQGVLVLTSRGEVSASRLFHYADGSTQAERIDALDGEARTVVRLNDTVHTLWPRARLAVIEQRDMRATFPMLYTGSERRVLDAYELRPLGPDRVAGFDADVVLMRARDSLRFSQRLWAEKHSGLILRADVLAANGQVLESSAFSELTIGVKPQVDALQTLVRRLDGYRIARPTALPVTLEGEGWQLPAPPAGFREVQCARRLLGPAGDAQAPQVLQAIYTDGLSDVSLFIEPYQGDRHQARTGPPVGATHTLALRRDAYWITLVGDVPDETLQHFADALGRSRH
jgi:sigma-E factor negative regulatory protein RseB